MTSPYRPSPFTSHPTVVMPDTKSEPPISQPQSQLQLQPKQKAVRYGLYVALVLAILYAIWTWTR